MVAATLAGSRRLILWVYQVWCAPSDIVVGLTRAATTGGRRITADCPRTPAETLPDHRRASGLLAGLELGGQPSQELPRWRHHVLRRTWPIATERRSSQRWSSSPLVRGGTILEGGLRRPAALGGPELGSLQSGAYPRHLVFAVAVDVGVVLSG